MIQNLTYFLLVLLGISAHTILKYQGLKEDAKAANMKLSFKDFILNDWDGIALSVIAGVIWIFIFGETAKLYPKLENYTYMSFAGVGFTGSYLLQRVNSRSKDLIRKVIDEKTNLADGVNSTESGGT